MAKLIADRGCDAHLLVGEGTASQRRAQLAKATDDAAEAPVLVATEGYLGEGFDYSRLDALFLATPISWDGNVTQQAGRLHRTHEGKTDVLIFDYVDASVPMLERMYKKRLKTYARLGYEVELDDVREDAHAASFVLAPDAMRLLIEDIHKASASIAIVAPYASAKATALVARALAEAHARGVAVSCALAKEPIESVRDMLGNAGADMHAAVGNAHGGLAVFDGKKVWYGTIPLLAFPKEDDCSIRFESAEAAHDLLEGSTVAQAG